MIIVGLFCLLLLIFHRPLLLFVTRQWMIHAAKKEHLQLRLTLAGSVFTNLVATNIHATSTGLSDVESIDIDFARVDYGLLDLIRGRKPDFLRSIELRGAKIVTVPGPERPRSRSKKKRAELPSIFPEQVKLSDVSVLVRDQPRELAIEHLDLTLDPRAPGELRIGNLRLPTGQSWSKLQAATSYSNRNLIVRDLKLSDLDRISLLNVNASDIRKKQLLIAIEAAIGGGSISDTITLHETRGSVNSEVRVQATNVSADALNKYGLPKDFLSGQIEQLSIQGAGSVDKPKSWTGRLEARIKDFRAAGIHFDRCELRASAANATVTIESADAVQNNNAIQLRGWASLPEGLSDFGRAPLKIELASKDIDLQQLTSGMARPIFGLGEANGAIEIKNGELNASFNLTAGPVKFQDGSAERIALDLRASKVMPTSNSAKPWFTGLKSTITVNASKLQSAEYVFDAVTGSMSSVDGVLQIDQLNLERRQNNVVIHGQYQLPQDLKQISRTGEIEFSASAPELADFWTPDSPNKWSGPLQGAGQLKWKDGIGSGQFWLAGGNVKGFGLELKQLNAQSTVANNVVYLNDISATLDQQDFLRANAVVDLWGKHHYTGSIAARVSDLSKLQPLLRSMGTKNELAGSLTLDWSGGGDAIKFKNGGQLKLVLENGRFGNLKSLQANINATYSPEALDVPTIFLRSDRMDFQAIVQAKGETLEITKIQLDQGQAKYATGYISIPFIWKNLGTGAAVIPSSGNLLANFQSENIDLKKLFEDFGMTPVASGTLNVKLDGKGTVSNPDAHLDIDIRDLRSDKLPKLEPATFHLAAESQHNRLTISGKLQQAKIQPIELNASFPFDLPRIAREGKLADNTPLQAKLTMPRSSVNFVREFIPAVHEADGDIAIDVNLGGTVANPAFNGEAQMNMNVARASDPTLPALQNFKARLVFAKDVLSFDQFAGELSGGHFTLGGRISFPTLTSPNVELKFKADSALIARDDSMTIRTDADLQFRGPLKSVNVTGNVLLTNSHLLKNLDLIPISLPGRPPPQPAAARPQLTLPPFFHDWKFDVAIKTKDSVLIRGNLATGGAVVDLRFIGAGARPGLDGLVRLENVEATLPFSRLEISYGFLYFKPDDPLNPKIDLHGTSVIQDYNVHVYIYGTALAPEAVFSSEPPLPQEDLISLLSTGTTREQLTGNNNVLAGRAAMLLFQQLYRKVFKKGQATDTNSVFDRFDLDVGTVDPRTGQQQATARFKINNQFVLVGDLGVGGDYKGMVKYLIRFH